MSAVLDSPAEKLLKFLVGRLTSAVPGRPETYVRYKETHDALGLSMQGGTYGESLKHQGLESLARWCQVRKHPAITGLVVDGATFQPGDGYFKVYGMTSDDYEWWKNEIAKSKRYKWSEVFADRGVEAGGSVVSASSDSDGDAGKPYETTCELDEEFKNFLAGFREPTSHYLLNWLPRYQETILAVRKSVESGDLDDAFELIWRSQDNDVAHAGQGILSFESVDRLAERLKYQILEIVNAPTPATFARVSELMLEWRNQGLIKKVPSLLIARAFASLAPDTYHTTVDSEKHDRVIEWMEKHSNFRCPESSNWAARAAAVSRYLKLIPELSGDPLLRNMFPWFVFEQIDRPEDEKPTFRPGFRERPVETDGVTLARTRRIRLRHNLLTKLLVLRLQEEFGDETAGADQPSGSGGWVDAILKNPNGEIWLYEIKVAPTASLAVREALGQLLEYGFQKGGWNPEKLWVVAEPDLDPGTAEYLLRLRKEFKLPIDYLQLVVTPDSDEAREVELTISQSAVV